MATNKGKKFEDAIRQSFEKVPDVSIDRIPDQVTRYRGSSSNICDFVVYKFPILCYIECKSVKGNTLSIHSIPKKGKDGKLHGFYGNIRDNQWTGLRDKAKIDGVVAGVICWWIDHDVTKFIPIDVLEHYRKIGRKSINFSDCYGLTVDIWGEKKRVYFDYEMDSFLKQIEDHYMFERVSAIVWKGFEDLNRYKGGD